MAEGKRSSVAMLVAVAFVVGGSAVGVLVWQLIQSGPAPVADRSGFDVQVVEERSSSARYVAPTQQSSLMSISGAPTGMTLGDRPASGSTGKPQAAQAPKDKEKSVRELALAAERNVYKLAQDYTRKYPSIAQYGRDWMSHPELRQLNYDYLRDRDPIKFMRGLAKSENFPKLVKKYAADPNIHAFVRDAVKEAPSGLTGAVSTYLTEDNTMKQFVGNVAQAMGIPKSLSASILGGGDPGKMDQKQIMAEVMQGNPDLQKAMSNPALQNNPDLQKALQR